MADNVSFTSIHDFYHYYTNSKIYIQFGERKNHGYDYSFDRFFLKRKREKLDGRTWINEFGKLVVRFRSKLEGRRESCQFESNPDLAHQPFHRRILACNVTCSLRGQLFRNWTGERGQTSFQTNDPATLSVIYIFRLDPTPLDRPTIFIHFFHFVNTPRNFDIWRMKLINIPGHVLYIYSLP